MYKLFTDRKIFCTLDLLSKDCSATISRFRRRGVPLCGNASRLYCDFAKIIHHIRPLCFIIFATLARNLIISLRKSLRSRSNIKYMPHQFQKPIDYSKIATLTKAILLTIGLGTVLATALIAPNAVQIFRPFLGQGRRRDHERKRIKQALAALRRRRIVEYFEKGGDAYIRITKKGRACRRRFTIETLTLPQLAWDRKWRIILFDIPESKGKARRALQQQLRALGCMHLQKSVLVYPHPCQDEIDVITSFWDVYPFVHYIETNDLGNAEGPARRFFGLL